MSGQETTARSHPLNLAEGLMTLNDLLRRHNATAAQFAEFVGGPRPLTGKEEPEQGRAFSLDQAASIAHTLALDLACYVDAAHAALFKGERDTDAAGDTMTLGKSTGPSTARFTVEGVLLELKSTLCTVLQRLQLLGDKLGPQREESDGCPQEGLPMAASLLSELVEAHFYVLDIGQALERVQRVAGVGVVEKSMQKHGDPVKASSNRETSWVGH